MNRAVVRNLLTFTALVGVSLYPVFKFHSHQVIRLASNSYEDETYSPQNVDSPTKRTVSDGGEAIPTLDCARFLEDAKNQRLGFKDPNEAYPAQQYQRETVHEDRSFWISIHNQKFDPVRWFIMVKGIYYEQHLERIWRQILENSPKGSKVLDVGGNIGYFSLVSLAMGDFVVDTFEPNPVNFFRICESLALNNWTLTPENADSVGIHVHPVGVSDQVEVLPFVVKPNPGASQFLPRDSEELRSVGYTNVTVTTIDSFAEKSGWFASEPHIAILKIDVEALESKVIFGASRLLQTGLVRNVFMEVSARNPQEERDGTEAIGVLINAGYKLAGYGRWRGPGNPVPWPQNASLVNSILTETRKHKQLNLWWSTQLPN